MTDRRVQLLYCHDDTGRSASDSIWITSIVLRLGSIANAGPLRSNRRSFEMLRKPLEKFPTAAFCLMALALFSSRANATPLSPEQFESLSEKCAPLASVNAIKLVSDVESHFEPYALRNNTKHFSLSAESQAAGIVQAKQWIAGGDSVDLGLMQINSGNLAKLGLTVETALDPCRSLAAGALILSAAYSQGSSVAEQEAALLIAFSRYNTGRSLAGLANGYAGRILASLGKPKPSNSTNSKQPDWNIWAVASAAQHDGAAWLVDSQDTPNFLIGAGAQPTGEPHALSPEPGTASGM